MGGNLCAAGLHIVTADRAVPVAAFASGTSRLLVTYRKSRLRVRVETRLVDLRTLLVVLVPGLLQTIAVLGVGFRIEAAPWLGAKADPRREEVAVQILRF